MKKLAMLLLVFAITTAQAQEYSLDLSGVTERQLLEDYDPAWQPEYRYSGFAFQVDPDNGGQISVWRNSGNPSGQPGIEDYSSYVKAGPPAGMPVRVCMKFIHKEDGPWVSTSHSPNDPNNDDIRPGNNEQHYEIALQEHALQGLRDFR